ncbi:MAG: hypothetical protein LBC44_00720 [Mycoplasmataceae bacterium]|nr:hypothetical protein [Mycoplasmataceae bacterium]
MNYINWKSYKWRTFWIHDSELGKNFSGIELKGKRKIMIYSASRELSGKLLYFEMSSHAEIGSPGTSVKVAEWIDKTTGKKKESWVLTNRIGLIKNGDILNLVESTTIENEYKNVITKKFDSVFSTLLLDEVLKLREENKSLEETQNLNRAIAKKVIEEKRTKEKIINEVCNIKNLDELVKLQEKLKNELAEKKQEEKKKDNEEEQENEFNLK